jgi:hypothetical protein
MMEEVRLANESQAKMAAEFMPKEGEGSKEPAVVNIINGGVPMPIL